MGDAFTDLQERLHAAWTLNARGVGVPHTVVTLPSFSIGESLLYHYANRIPSLEHRYLVALWLLRFPAARIVYITSRHPGNEIVDYYLGFLPPHLRPAARDRLLFVVLNDPSPRPVASKLLDRPDLIHAIKKWIGEQPAFIEPWNVAAPERDVAFALDIPIYGTDPRLWPLAFKSSGRHFFARAGVPVPAGFEDLHTVAEAVESIERLRALKPGIEAVVIKHDNSGAGDGNVVVNLRDVERPGSKAAQARLRGRMQRLAPWYLTDLQNGFVVEEKILGDEFASPSAQIDITPEGEVRLLSTHEQVLGGDDGQVYTGCTFPANLAYAAEIGRNAAAVGKSLALEGAVGRASVDFAAVREAGGAWKTYALEINLRKGGTTHPFSVLRSLVPGFYDPTAGTYFERGGQPKHYRSTDNMADERWTGLTPATVIDAVRQAGLSFDPVTHTGVVLHMLTCLAIDGRFGVTAVGNSAEQADSLFKATEEVVAEAGRQAMGG